LLGTNWVAVFQLTRGVGGVSDAFHAFGAFGEQKERPTTRVSLVYLEVTLQSGFFCGQLEKQKCPQDFKNYCPLFLLFLLMIPALFHRLKMKNKIKILLGL